MADPSYTKLRAYHHTVDALMADPDVTADLLLVGIWMARAVHLRIPEPGHGDWTWKRICADIYGADGHNELYRLTRVLRDDLPRYDPHRDRDGWGYPPCAAPMIRRDGACGQPSTKEQLLTDLDTGRGMLVGACSRHRSWLDAHLLDNRQQVKTLGDQLPRPASNCGGLLARHIPRGIGWRKLYQSLDANWRPVKPAAATKPVKPTLRVLTFEPCDDAEHEAANGERPALSMIPGGQR